MTTKNSKEVVNYLLGYPNLQIIQRTDMFNFSLDSILLAFFATVNKKTKRIVDFCTGNAPIPMYLTLRTKASIDCVEIQEDSYDLGKRSIELNNLQDQINIINDNVKGVSKKLTGYYDLVTVNPPYFEVKDDKRFNDSEYKTIARHEVLINLEEIIKEAKSMLNNGGYFAMVHRPNRLVDILSTMKKHNIQPRRVRFVHSFIHKEANMVLVEGRLSTGDSDLKVLEPLIVFDKVGQYSQEVLNMFNFGKSES